MSKFSLISFDSCEEEEAVRTLCNELSCGDLACDVCPLLTIHTLITSLNKSIKETKDL